MDQFVCPVLFHVEYISPIEFPAVYVLVVVTMVIPEAAVDPPVHTFIVKDNPE
jgi:hypothetical protein